jgi:hypothetical protein
MPPNVDYTSLEEWRRDHRMTIEKMAEVASGRGAKVSAKTLGTAFRDGLPLHGRVLFAWERAFGWTREETLWLCMGGSAPRREERMLQTVMFSVEDLFELARRKE